MSLIRAIVLGIVQGLTEFLPISSSAHLRVVPALLNWDDPGAAFTAVIQLGTMAAVLLYFRKDLWSIASTWLRSLRDRELRRDHDARMGWYLVIATIPIAVIGFLLKDQIKSGARDLRLIAIDADRLRTHPRLCRSGRQAPQDDRPDRSATTE